MRVPSPYIDRLGLSRRLSHQNRGFWSVGHTAVSTRQTAGSSPTTSASASEAANVHQTDRATPRPSGGGTSRAKGADMGGRSDMSISGDQGFITTPPHSPNTSLISRTWMWFDRKQETS